MTDDEIIAVVAAHKAGKRIQIRPKKSYKNGSEGWCDANHLLWNFAENEYRVKPEPRTFWVNRSHLFDTAASIPPLTGEMVLVREVVE